MNYKKLSEKLSIDLAKNPGRLMLIVILLFNIIFFTISAIIISNLSLSGTEHMGFIEAAFCTIMMILDAGCIQFVISDIGEAGVLIASICFGVIFIGMISFTGAVIGYITNYMSRFIENAASGTRKLKITHHAVIINWNNRASEIINDLLYCDTPQKVVVLTNDKKTIIEREISERISDTIAKENALILAHYKDQPIWKKIKHFRQERLKNNVTVIVREGDIYSAKQLHDISLPQARMIVILGDDTTYPAEKILEGGELDNGRQGNSQTIKTLMQVADITGAEYSHDNQKIIVEITDDWTLELTEKIIKCKQVEGKSNIVPVRINQILGQILSQFSLMPELNLAYRELFSNRGTTFFLEEHSGQDELAYVRDYLNTHKHAIPLTMMDSGDQSYFYYASGVAKDIQRQSNVPHSEYQVSLNYDYWIERKNVIILGHNSKCSEIMHGFAAFCGEWDYLDAAESILHLVVIDTAENLNKVNHYKQYPFVMQTVAADIYDKDLICNTIDQFISSNGEDTSVLILSDDMATPDQMDTVALANLVYVQDIIEMKMEENHDFDPNSVDVIVEIIDPKHHDIVSSYSVSNVIISNRYISKMITQIGEKEALYDFYADILTYDTDDSQGFQSKEIYVKKVSRLFKEVPGPCTAGELIRAVYDASINPNLPPKKRNPTIPLGYVNDKGEMTVFSGNQWNLNVALTAKDKLLVFSNH